MLMEEGKGGKCQASSMSECRNGFSPCDAASRKRCGICRSNLASDDASARLFNDGIISSLELASELHCHQGCVNSIEFNESGTLLLSGSDDLTLGVFETVHYEKLGRFRTAHDANIFSGVFVPGRNDSTVASCGLDGKTCLTVLETEHSRVLAQSHAIGSRVMFSPACENLLMVGVGDGSILSIDLRTNTLQRCYLQSTAVTAINCFCVSPAHPYTVAIGTNTPYVHLVDIRLLRSTEALETNFAFLTMGCPGLTANSCDGIGGINFNSAGDRIVASYKSNDVYVFDMQPNLRYSWRGGFASPDDLAPYGNADRWGQVVATYAKRYRGRRNENTMFKEAVFFHNDEYVATGGDCGNLFVWNCETEKLIRRTPADNDIVNGVLVHPNLNCIVTCGIDDTSKVFEPVGFLRPPREHHTNGPQIPVTSLQWGFESLNPGHVEGEEQEELEEHSSTTTSSESQLENHMRLVSFLQVSLARSFWCDHFVRASSDGCTPDELNELVRRLQGMQRNVMDATTHREEVSDDPATTDESAASAESVSAHVGEGTAVATAKVDVNDDGGNDGDDNDGNDDNDEDVSVPVPTVASDVLPSSSVPQSLPQVVRAFESRVRVLFALYERKKRVSSDWSRLCVGTISRSNEPRRFRELYGMAAAVSTLLEDKDVLFSSPQGRKKWARMVRRSLKIKAALESARGDIQKALQNATALEAPIVRCSPIVAVGMRLRILCKAHTRLHAHEGNTEYILSSARELRQILARSRHANPAQRQKARWLLRKAKTLTQAKGGPARQSKE